MYSSLAVPGVLYPACVRAGHPQFSVSCVIVCVISAQVIDLTHAQPPASSVPAAQPKAAQAAAGGAPPLQLKQAPPAAAKKKGPAASGKKGPKEPLAGGGKERFKSVKQVSVPGAEYFDQSIGWAVLRDGRELLLGCEVWHVPAGFADHPKTHAPTQVGKMPETLYNRFTPLAGTDLVAVMGGSVWGNGLQFLALHTLPACEEVARLEMPSGLGRIRHITSAGAGVDGVSPVLLTDDDRLLLLSVTHDNRVELTLSVDLRAPGSPLAAALGAGGDREQRVQSVALWRDPEHNLHACLGSRGRVLVVPLSGAPRVVRVIHMHTPMRKSDTDARVYDMAIWNRCVYEYIYIYV